MPEDTNNENPNSQNGAEQVDTGSTGADTNDTGTSPESEVDVAKLQETNKKLFERAKKAEAELKELRAKPAPAPKPTAPPTSPASVEETVLRANGMPQVLLKELKAVATARGVGLLDAQTDPLFVAYKEKFEADERIKAASLPASRGSGGVKPKKDTTTPGLSEEEHKALFHEKMGR